MTTLNNPLMFIATYRAGQNSVWKIHLFVQLLLQGTEKEI